MYRIMLKTFTKVAVLMKVCTDKIRVKKQTGISGPMLGVLRIIDAILSKERLGLLAVHGLILTYHLKA